MKRTVVRGPSSDAHLSIRERSPAKRRVRVSDVRLEQADPHPGLLLREKGPDHEQEEAEEKGN